LEAKSCAVSPFLFFASFPNLENPHGYRVFYSQAVRGFDFQKILGLSYESYLTLKFTHKRASNYGQAENDSTYPRPSDFGFLFTTKIQNSEERQMNNWHKNRNYRNRKNVDGTTAYFIRVDGTEVEISKEIYREYASVARKMEYMEYDLKRDRVLKDANGRAVTDKNGMPVVLPEREVSLDKLVDEDWDYPADEQQPETALLQKMELEELHRCLDLLDGDERALIQALFFENMTIREYAELSEKTKSSVDRLKTKTLGKLKKLLSD
jgi:RNA polymerase sigma factor (sigma-70 family)